MEIWIPSLNNHLEPQTTSLKRMFGETTISYVKIGFIIQLIANHLLMVGRKGFQPGWLMESK